MGDSEDTRSGIDVLDRAVRSKREELEKRIREVLLASIYENRYTLHPRQLQEHAAAEVDGLIEFLEGRRADLAEDRGRRAAHAGLGVSSVLGLFTVIETFATEKVRSAGAPALESVLSLLEEYRSAFLTGCFEERDSQLLKDQEQLRRALAAVLERQSRELQVRNYAIGTTINGILISDLDGTVNYVNAAFLKMWGFAAASEALGAHVTSFWKGTRAKEIFENLSETDGWHGELTALRRDESFFEVELSASVIRDETGNALGIMSSFIDITESKRLRDHVFHRQKMEALGELAGGIAHDFNNLLTAISGYVQLMLADADPESELHKDLVQIKTAVDRGADLTKQLRFFTRQASGVRQFIDVNQLIKETSDLVKRTFPLEIAVEPALSPDLWSIHADPSQISQVLMNLCVNARDAIMAAVENEEGRESEKAKKRGGTMALSSENVVLDAAEASEIFEGHAGNFVRIRVRDNGIGMAPKVVEKLFEPFFTTKELRSGSGLGLAVVYGIVHNHGGFIAVESELGRGSSFEVYLPAVEKAASKQEEWRPPTRAKLATGDILVVDDEQQVGDVLDRALKRWGYTPAVFRDAREAVKYFSTRHTQIDLVILDMLMPKMDGRECYARLREIDPEVRVVVITGHTDDVTGSGPIMDGVLATLEKPLDLTNFAGVLERILQRPA